MVVVVLMVKMASFQPVVINRRADWYYSIVRFSTVSARSVSSASGIGNSMCSRPQPSTNCAHLVKEHETMPYLTEIFDIRG